MKLRKSKLAALLLSVMAVGAMSSFAYASDDTPAVINEEDTAGYEVGSITFKYEEDGSYDVEYTLVSAETGEEYSKNPLTATAYVAEGNLVEPTCTDEGYIILYVDLLGETYSSGKITIDATDHDYDTNGDGDETTDDAVLKQTVAATCTEEGTGYYLYTCTVCGATKKEYVSLSMLEHSYSSEKVVIATNGNVDVAIGDVIDGEVLLIDPTTGGSYTIAYVCENDDCDATKDEETIYIQPTQAKYVMVEKVSGIEESKGFGGQSVADYTADQKSTDLTSWMLDNDEIELNNCEESGYYTIVYYDADGEPIAEREIEVTPHHMLTAVVAAFDSEADYDTCADLFDYDEDGNVIVTSSTCVAVEYTAEVHCKAAGCPLEACSHSYESEAVNGENYAGYPVVDSYRATSLTSDHVILNEAKIDIAALVASEGEDLQYSELETLLEKKSQSELIYGDYVTLSENTATCTEGATITITYYCIYCGEPITTETVEVAALGHNWSAPTVQNYVEPTCTSEGSYDRVIYCLTCGEVKSSEAKTVARLAHSNEYIDKETGEYVNDYSVEGNKIVFSFSGTKIIDDYNKDDGYLKAGATYTTDYDVIDGNYIGYSTPEFGLTVTVYSYCSVCGEHELILTDPEDEDAESGTIDFTVIDVESQNENGAAGYITINVEYTGVDGESDTSGAYTAKYYSSMAAYVARLEEDSTDDDVAVTDPDETTKNGLVLDSDGVYRYYLAGTFAEDFTAVISYDGAKFFVKNGLIDTDADGLCQDPDTLVWYYVADGQVQSQYTGLVLYDGAWFFVTAGKLDTSKIGLVEYDGETFLVSDGKLRIDVSGLWFNSSTIGGDDQWYFIGAGMVQAVSQVVEYDGQFFVVVDGVLDSDYNGTIVYDGVEFTVVGGQLYAQVQA